MNAKEKVDLYKCRFDKCDFAPLTPSLIDLITQVQWYW
jgi:hypothetical protein